MNQIQEADAWRLAGTGAGAARFPRYPRRWKTAVFEARRICAALFSYPFLPVSGAYKTGTAGNATPDGIARRQEKLGDMVFCPAIADGDIFFDGSL